MAVIQIGQLLVEQGVLTQVQVAAILAEQRVSHRPFGDLAERLFGVDPRAVEDAWVQQYIKQAGVTDLSSQRIEIDALRLINRRQAWQFHMLPLNRSPGEINLATSPQGLIRALNFSTASFTEEVSIVLAEHDQLREFLMKHYPVSNAVANYAEGLKAS